MNVKPKVAFICVHNSCRSEIAEALGRKFASDVFESYSAGTEKRSSINQDAVRIIKAIYDLDMEENQKPKLLSALPSIDIVITMGCNVKCPTFPSRYREDWGLEDPTGKNDEEFKKIINQIELNIFLLKKKIKEGIILKI